MTIPYHPLCPCLGAKCLQPCAYASSNVSAMFASLFACAYSYVGAHNHAQAVPLSPLPLVWPTGSAHTRPSAVSSTPFFLGVIYWASLSRSAVLQRSRSNRTPCNWCRQFMPAMQSTSPTGTLSQVLGWVTVAFRST